MDILYVSDNGYFNIMRLSIISVLKLHYDVTFHIFTMDSPETNKIQISKQNKLKIKEDIKRLNPTCKIKFYDVRELYLNKMSLSVNKDSKFTPYAALRLLAPYIITDVDLLLYLDCDTLACQPLYELFDIYKNIDFDFAATPAFDKNGKFAMFLTTSLLFNLDFQRKTHYKFINEAIEIYNCKKLDFPDQEAISMAKSKSLKLDFSYNMGYFDEGYTKVFFVFYRTSEKVRNYLQLYYPLKAEKIFVNMERIIKEVFQIQSSQSLPI